MKSLFLFALMLGCVGCGKGDTSTTLPSSSTNDNYGLLSYRLQYITFLNNDTAAISRCTSEVLTIGHHGPVCRLACDTADKLIKFEQDNQAYMLRDGDKPSTQHRWCMSGVKSAKAKP